MNRLTQKNERGKWSLKGVSWKQLMPGEKITRITNSFLYGALYKLMRYEDTGLSPEQIREMDELYHEKCREVAELKKKQQWIPVEEQLPENVGRYLITALWEDGAWKKYSVYDASYGSDGIWHTVSYVPVPYRVVAWMPLPEPYRQQSVNTAPEPPVQAECKLEDNEH